jgi:hypothetical protein
MEKIMTIDELALALRLGVSTVRRKISDCRKGKIDFVLPISPPGCKCRFRESDVIRHVELQSTPPVTSMTVSSVKQQRWDAKAFEERQKIAKDRLAAHAKQRTTGHRTK